VSEATAPGGEFGLDHWIEHNRIVQSITKAIRDKEIPQDPDRLLRHLFDAHGLTVNGHDDDGLDFAMPLLGVFEMRQLAKHDDAHPAEDALDLCAWFAVNRDMYRERCRVR
jgi:hypothetical protein